MTDGPRGVLCVFVMALVVLAATAGFGAAVPFADDPNAGSGATSGGTDAPGIYGASVSGEGYVEDQERIVQDHPGPAYVWSNEPLTLTATVGGEAPDEELTLCAEATDDDDQQLADLGCQDVTLTGGEQEVEFAIERWSNEYQGAAWITLTLLSDGQETHYETVPVTVVHPDGDLSGDGLTNAEEVRYGTDFTTPDTTGNGLTDWQEVEVYGSDPLVTDTSGDGVSDATAVRLGLDPTIPYLPYVYVGGGLLLVVLVVAGGGALGWQFVRRYADETPTASESEPTEPDPTPRRSADEPQSVDSSSEPSPEMPPLTKEEEICRLLREHGGRMKQSALVDRTEWSQATVSRLISKLEDDGVVTKLRSGRENIVELRGEATDAESTEPSSQ